MVQMQNFVGRDSPTNHATVFAVSPQDRTAKPAVRVTAAPTPDVGMEFSHSSKFCAFKLHQNPAFWKASAGNKHVKKE